MHSDITGGRKAFVLLPTGETVPESHLESCYGCHSSLFAAPRRLLSALAAITERINSTLEIRRGTETFCFTLLKFITILNAVVFVCQGPQKKAPQTGGLNKTCYFFRQGYLDRHPVEKDQRLKTSQSSPSALFTQLSAPSSGPSPSFHALSFSKEE